jgi:hypothetical protein
MEEKRSNNVNWASQYSNRGAHGMTTTKKEKPGDSMLFICVPVGNMWR